MTRTRRLAAALVLALAAPAMAWESDTTHAGLTERAALASKVNARLGALRAAGGWLTPLTVAPEHARDLLGKLAVVEPSSGAVPDRIGRLSALGWLTAGSVVEGLPAARGANHFLDPSPARRAPIGIPAPDWILARDNDLGLPRFWLELEAAGTAAAPAERDEHLALALVCAGAMLHVLEDMGAPARVRADEAEFGLPLGGGLGDRGSRFERLAALLDGRLGIPDPLPAVTRDHARDFFTAADGKGLADVTRSHWYSSGTLPARVELRGGALLERVRAAQAQPLPRPEQELDTQGERGAVRDADGVCLADYAIEDDRVRFFISDECAGAQLAAILPVVGAYATGFVDWLFRGALDVAVKDGAVVVTSAATLGAGQVTVLAEDKDGRRSALGTSGWSGTAQVAVQAGAVRYVAIFRGVDGAGETLVAFGGTAAP
jgi:hypothetical protein